MQFLSSSVTTGEERNAFDDFYLPGGEVEICERSEKISGGAKVAALAPPEMLRISTSPPGR
jgi:hypothetical protein